MTVDTAVTLHRPTTDGMQPAIPHDAAILTLTLYDITMHRRHSQPFAKRACRSAEASFHAG